MSSDFAHSTVSYTSISSEARSCSIPTEDPDEDPKEDPSDGGDDDDDDNESSGDDVNDDDEKEEEEHLASTDSSVVPTVNLVPSSEDTGAFETDESALTPPSPRPRWAWISVRLPPPTAASMEARITKYAAAPTSPSPPPSPITPLSSPLPQIPSPPLPLPSPPIHTSPTYAEAPLGYKAARIRSRAASPLPLPAPSSPLKLPTTSHREDVPEADVPPRKRLCLTALTSKFEIRESSATAAAR
ncbi:hypothetical protein Tco_0887251 [Tanacetum coccineum]